MPLEQSKIQDLSHVRSNSSSSSSSGHLSSPVHDVIPPFASTISNHSGSYGANRLGSDASLESSPINPTIFQQKYGASGVPIPISTRKPGGLVGHSAGRTHAGNNESDLSAFDFDLRPSISSATNSSSFAGRAKEGALAKAKIFARHAAKPQSRGSTGMAHKKSPRSDSDYTSPNPSISQMAAADHAPLPKSSRELERIASIGTLTSSITGQTSSREEKHKHHMPFRSRKEGHVTLSSSSSNSKLIPDQDSLYSFSPSSPGALQRSFPSLEIKNLGLREDKELIAESAWSLLKSRIAPLFLGEHLRVPVEDLNQLVNLHIGPMIQKGVPARQLLSDMQELLGGLMVKLESRISTGPEAQLITRLTDTWRIFFSHILPYLEAVFLPLQKELDGVGKFLSSQEAKEYWGLISGSAAPTSARRMILISFRDNVMLPMVDQLEVLLSQRTFDYESSFSVPDVAAQLLQSLNLLTSMQSGDEKQARMTHLTKTMKATWLTRRSGKDRRGFVLSKAPDS